MIHVGRFTQRPFTEDDTRLLQLVAFRVALAIDNARLFEEERAARREAEAANRAKDEFLTTLSHELRTPLTPVIGWIHMVRTGMLPTQQMDHGLSVIEKNAHALKRLINDLLDMTAILSGKMRMEELPVHLGQVVHEAIETVRPFAATRQIHVEVTFRNWDDEIVIGDTTRLGQVFANLLHNAVKFSPPGGTVRLTCETDGQTRSSALQTQAKASRRNSCRACSRNLCRPTDQRRAATEASGSVWRWSRVLLRRMAARSRQKVRAAAMAVVLRFDCRARKRAEFASRRQTTTGPVGETDRRSHSDCRRR